ncbi:hypothetical protein ACOTET_22875 [Achromobacter xylosoxidans]
MSELNEKPDNLMAALKIIDDMREMLDAWEKRAEVARESFFQMSNVYGEMAESYRETVQSLITLAREKAEISRKDLIGVLEGVPDKMLAINEKATGIQQEIRRSYAE